VGPRAVLDIAVLKRKIPSPCRESKPRTPIKYENEVNIPHVKQWDHRESIPGLEE
jgi:hypothetical protein